MNEEEKREMIEQAHMAGQTDAGVEAGYSNARAYANEILAETKEVQTNQKQKSKYEFINE